MSADARCYIATPPRWSGLREDRRVASARDIPDYEAQGWTVEGPFVPAERDHYREALERIVAYSGWDRSNSWKVEQVCETAREALDG